jgi:hypothetical protein
MQFTNFSFVYIFCYRWLVAAAMDSIHHIIPPTYHRMPTVGPISDIISPSGSIITESGEGRASYKIIRHSVAYQSTTAVRGYLLRTSRLLSCQIPLSFMLSPLMSAIAWQSWTSMIEPYAWRGPFINPLTDMTSTRLGGTRTDPRFKQNRKLWLAPVEPHNTNCSLRG